MRLIFNRRSLPITIAVLVIGFVCFIVFRAINPSTPEWITAEVERGNVTETVSVSGFIEAKNTANLAFPASGIVTDVFVQEGDTVTKGQILATLASSQLVAQRNEASALLNSAEAQYDQLLAGPSTQERLVTQQNIANAESNLERTITIEAEKVTNAREILFSNNLIAQSNDGDETAVAPTISGTYTCGDEGEYTLEAYSSNAYSGYSYKFSGLEEGSNTVYTQHSSPLGSCGLYIQFDADSYYGNTKWTITIPNTNSATYATNKSAYDLAVKNQNNNIKAAEDALALVKEQASVANATPRGELVTQSQASIQQAVSKIAAIDAQIADRSIVAPFAGTVTAINILPGETAGPSPIITLLATDTFRLKARVPEIDITKIKLGQAVRVVFDAQSSETLIGSVTYISPLATTIDGVAYFETTITLESSPEWIRSGLNADIDITVGLASNTLRIPKRFLISNKDGSYSVQTPIGTRTATTTVDVSFVGNDGYVEIIGLNEGDTVIAP